MRTTMKRDQVKLLNPSLTSVLPAGSHRRIARDLGLFLLTVSNALHGRCNNERVIVRALEILREERERIEAVLKQAEAAV